MTESREEQVLRIAQETDEQFSDYSGNADTNRNVPEPASLENLEPVAIVARNASGQIHLTNANGDTFDISRHVGKSFYVIPPGMVLVPVEPTDKMLKHGTVHLDLRTAYKAMLNAWRKE